LKICRESFEIEKEKKEEREKETTTSAKSNICFATRDVQK
jgi:hypothetical protein